jgi:hypothetical protein
MLYREIVAVCSEIHTKHTNTLCGQNVEFTNVNLVVSTVTSIKIHNITKYWRSFSEIQSLENNYVKAVVIGHRNVSNRVHHKIKTSNFDPE